jgi:hypothetical protein
MNTQGENNYQELFSGRRMKIVTRETRRKEYNFQITDDILEDFERWKADHLESTDELPTELDILAYFMSSPGIKSTTESSENLEVTSRAMYGDDE